MSISLVLLLGIYAPTYNIAWSQTPFNTGLIEDSDRESFLAPLGQKEKVDPKVEDRILKGLKEAQEALKEKGKKLLVTALPTMPGQLKNHDGSPLARSSGINAISSLPSTITWEFQSDIPVSGFSEEQAEPDIISSEINDGNLVAAYSDFSSGPNRCRLASSSDAGASWADRGIMQIPAGTFYHSDPVLATNSKGEFIATCLAFDQDSNGDFTSSAIIMQISTDKGVTWSSPKIIAGSTSNIAPISNDKEWVASDANVHSPYRDRSYMCWTKFDDPSGTSKIIVKRIQPNLGSQKVLATAADDLTDIVQGCNVAVGPRGEVAVAWYQARPTDPSIQGRIVLSRSYDGGASWTSGKTVATFTKIPPCSGGPFGCLSGVDGNFRVNQFPEITWDRLDNLLVTYADYIAGDPDILFTSSSNCATPTGSCTFFSPIVVNDDATLTDQFFPSIIASDKITDVNDRGIVHIVAQDKREDSDNLSWRPWSYHCNLSSGCDSSSEWSGSNPQVPVSFDLFSNSGVGDFVGDYNGLTTGDGVASSSSRQAHAIWFDNVGGIPDIYSDRTAN